MTTIDRDRLRRIAEATKQPGVTYDDEFVFHSDDVLPLLDALEQADTELDYWMTRAYEAEKRAWQAEARIKAVEEILTDLEQQPANQIGWDVASLLPDLRRALDGERR